MTGAAEFEAQRAYLEGVAYRMLGSVTEAQDAVQTGDAVGGRWAGITQCWLRLRRADRSEIDNLEAWLTRVIARICLDMLGSARARREESACRSRRSRRSWAARPPPCASSPAGPALTFGRGSPGSTPTPISNGDRGVPAHGAGRRSRRAGGVARPGRGLACRCRGTAGRATRAGARSDGGSHDDHSAGAALRFLRPHRRGQRLAGLLVADAGTLLAAIAFTVSNGRITEVNAVYNQDKLAFRQ